MKFPASLGGRLAVVLSAVAFLSPLIGLVAPRGIALLWVLGAVTGLAIMYRHRTRPNALAVPILVLLVLLGGWALVSSLWAIDFRSAPIAALKFLGGVAAGWVLFGLACRLDNQDAQGVYRALVAGLALNFGILAIDIATRGKISRLLVGMDYGSRREIFWFSRDVVVLVLLSWPLALMAWARGKPLLAAAPFMGTIAAAAYIGHDTALWATLTGLAAALAVNFLGRWAARAIGLAAASGILAAPFLVRTLFDPLRLGETMPFLPNSAVHRVYIWNFAYERISDHPWLGWGMDASPDVPGGMEVVRVSDPVHTWGFLGQLMPLHPHNMPLQIWLELGMVGAVLTAILTGLILWRAVTPARPRESAAMITGQFTATIVFMAASFGAWQSWWHGAVWIAATLMALAARPDLAAGGRT